MKTEHPIYEFRPLPKFFAGNFRRYANGEWIPDDGEYDLAFIGDAQSGEGWTFPCCLYVKMPYHSNIVCSWLTCHWSMNITEHPNSNPWHYALRAGETEWGGDNGRDSSENARAGQSGMNKIVSERHCANGASVEFNLDDKHIAAGLLRNRGTKEVFVWPTGMFCMYCHAEAVPKTSVVTI